MAGGTAGECAESEVKKLEQFKAQMMEYRQKETERMREKSAELSSERENMLFQELDDEMRPLPVARSSRLTAVFKTMTTDKSVRRLNLMESQFSYTSVEKYNPLVNTNRFFPSQDQRLAYVVMRC